MQGKPWGRKSLEFKVHSLIDKVYKPPNLYIAWEKVKANKGSGGVDRVSVEDFEQNLPQNLDEIHRLLKEDRYLPQPVRRVWIPKPNGDKRPLGIPAVRDRVVQQALLNRMQRIFEPKFSDCSFGFKPGRSPHQAIEKVEEYLKRGCQWVVEVDIEKFFDTVDQKKLMNLVAEEIADGRVLRLIQSFLRCGVMEDMKVEYRVTGTP
jgi:group II intron reverse transcriptase/maturase